MWWCLVLRGGSKVGGQQRFNPLSQGGGTGFRSALVTLKCQKRKLSRIEPHRTRLAGHREPVASRNHSMYGKVLSKAQSTRSLIERYFRLTSTSALAKLNPHQKVNFFRYTIYCALPPNYCYIKSAFTCFLPLRASFSLVLALKKGKF